MEALHEAGVPPEALSLLPGYGEAGAALVRDPRVHVIAFTGSSAVGLEIVRAAAETPDGQGHVKRVVAEMGGKNCVIVDADADLDEVVPELVHSAFGYAGQKCSAAARVLVHEAIADTLLERLAGAVSVLDVGQAERFATEVPPVIEREAQERVLPLRRAGASRSPRAPSAVPDEGWFCPPTSWRDLPGRLARADARRSSGRCWPSRACATSTRPATSSTRSRSPSPAASSRAAPRRSSAWRARSPVGNLYVNRGITGAMVGRQPFGGNRRSGIGSKAGGPDYLLQFVEPRVVTENTMRHGIPVD